MVGQGSRVWRVSVQVCEKGTYLRLLEPEWGEQVMHVREADTTESIAVRDNECWFLTEEEGIAKFGKGEKQNNWYWIKIEGLGMKL